MADAVFIAIVLAFFALATLFVRACDAIASNGEEKHPDPVADRVGAPEVAA